MFHSAVYKSGTGTRGRGHRNACVGTWGRETRDLRTSSMGHEDVWDEDAGASNTGTREVNNYRKSWRKMPDIGHFPREYVLVKVTHPDLLRVPPCLFTKRRLGEDPLH